MKSKTCPACGTEFVCLHTTWCWCTAYKLSNSQLKTLSKTYQDCLCPNCICKLNPKTKPFITDKFRFELAVSETDYSTAQILFEEYAVQLDFDLCFQDFRAELKILNKMYSIPEGGLILVRAGEDSIGCAAIRKMDEGVAELKRMYLKTEFRGLGLGKKLLKEAIKLVVNLGYKKIRLDTISKLKPAIQLYESAGFKRYFPSHFEPHPELLYFEKEL